MSYESFDELESVLSPQKPLLDIQLSHCDDCENRHSQDQSSSIHGSMMAFRPTTSNNTTGDECRPDRWSWAPQLFEDAAMDDIDSLLAFDFPSKTFASSGWWAEMNTFLPATESTDHSQAIPTHLHHHQATTDNSDLPATQVPLSDYRQQQPCSPWSDSSYLSPENAPSTYHDSPSPAGPGLILPSPPSPSAIPPLTLLQPIMAPAPTPDPMTFAPMPFQPVESKTLQPSAPIATSSLAPITPVVPVTPVSPVAAAAQVSSATSNLAETAMLSSFLTLAFDSSNPTEAPATSPTPPFLTVAPSATTASTIPSNAKATSNANIQGIQTGKTDVMAGVQPTAASVAALESMLWTHDAEMSEVTSSDWLVSESAHTLEWVVGTLPTPIQELDGRSSATIPGIQSE
ncbi:hypothetical protein BGZ73_000755 [Actinomortierella ambigua]|nr:hypothetical protein BGZ73_000755 [Actinomortierella ambigua]